MSDTTGPHRGQGNGERTYERYGQLETESENGQGEGDHLEYREIDDNSYERRRVGSGTMSVNLPSPTRRGNVCE